MDDHHNLYVDSEESIDIKAFIFKCLNHWYYFAIALFIAFFIAAVINKFSAPVYEVSSFILIREEENPLELQDFTGASLYTNPYQLQNEIGILKSKTLTERTVRALDLSVSYFREDRFRSTELYKSTPFIVNIDTLYAQPINVKFDIDFINDTLMSIEAMAEDVVTYNYISNADIDALPVFEFSDTVTYGELCGNQFCRFRIIPNYLNMGQIAGHRKYAFRFLSINMLIDQFSNTEIEAAKNSSILQISLKCSNVQKGVDYLNKLTDLFLIKGIERNDQIASATIEFIDSQLEGISDSLRFSEDKLQSFRASKGAINIDYQAEQTYRQMEELQDEKARLLVKSKYYNYLRDYLEKNNKVDDLIAPSSMDINDPLLNSLIIELTDLYGERTELSFNTVKDNPYLSSLEMQIADIKTKLIENIDNIIEASNISMNEIDERIKSIEYEINQLPSSQRELLVIERKFNLNDALYTYLLTKRSEVQITKASNIPSNEALDRASTRDYSIVSPNAKMNYIIALLLGLFIPASMVYLKDFFRSKIVDMKDLQSITSIPVMGHIIHNKFRNYLAVNDYPSSPIAESFRSLRTNFQFFPSVAEKNVILVTSIIKGEGKSFTSVNLGTAFAQNRKKVVVIDFDLRKSRIKQYLGIDTDEGLSRFLSNNAVLDDIIFPSGIENLDVITSGPVPPNPSELISSVKTDELFHQLKQRYDIIIIDSPPIAPVSDALLLLKHSNVRLLVIRQNVTPRELLATIISDLEKRNINNLNLILNDEKVGRDGYGYSYGYAYGYGYGYEQEEEKKSVKSRLMGFFSKS